MTAVRGLASRGVADAASKGVLEGVKKDVAGIDSIKERLTATSADFKAVRDDLTKLQQEVDRNRTADLERKNNRDAQCKQVEESLRDVQKGLQNCREKLARLEGMQPGSQPRGGFFPFEAPASPGRSSPPAE